jgi:hypothetical protein
MVRTSSRKIREDGEWICPECEGLLYKDNKGLGFVRHKSNPNCGFQKGERDGKYEKTSNVSNSPRALVEIGGYSERGIVNAIFYDIASALKPLDVLLAFLDQIDFTDKEKKLFKSISGIKIIIEHSISDFGDPDVVLLLHGCAENSDLDWKGAIFIEAKVKTSQGRPWTLNNEINSIFDKMKNTKSSNLFTQLHRKVVFSNHLRKQDGIEILKKGIPFQNSKKESRGIGDNPIVEEFIKIMKPYVSDEENVFFVAIVPPDPSSNTINIFKDIIQNKEMQSESYFGPDWNYKQWRCVTWNTVEEFCLQQKFNNSKKVFDWNKNQIY